MILIEDDDICDRCRGTGYGEHSNTSYHSMCDGIWCSETRDNILDYISDTIPMPIGSYVHITNRNSCIDNDDDAYILRMEKYKPRVNYDEINGKIINAIVYSSECEDDYIYAIKVKNAEILVKGADLKLWKR